MTARVYGRWMPDTDTGAGGGPSRCTPGHQASYCPDPREKLQLQKQRPAVAGLCFVRYPRAENHVGIMLSFRSLISPKTPQLMTT